jgi:uncharacterized protein (TIGR03437 family)
MRTISWACPSALIGVTLFCALAETSGAQVNVLTYQYNNSRTGLNAREVLLSPSNVNSAQFGKLFSDQLDGYVYGQPLYVAGLSIPGRGIQNIVFVATEHDSVYAFNADKAGNPLWKVSFLDPSNGVTTVPASDTGCGQIVPEIGITSTPVIDLASQTLYTVAMTKERGAYVDRLHALDLATGAEKPGSPVVVQATYPGNGDGGSSVAFTPKDYKQRPALLLLNGVIYTAWSSHCDLNRYHGWLIAYDASTLKQVSVYVDTPNSALASFWMSGAGPSADAAGNIYVVAGNGAFDGDQGGSNLGESVLKLSTSGGLHVSDWFAPYDYADLNDRDLDIGSSGALLLPDEAGGAAHPHLLITAGKAGKIYVLDRDHLGGFHSGGDTQIVQSLSGVIGPLFGIPAYFGNTVYFSSVGNPIKAFPIRNGLLSTTPSSQSPQTVYNFAAVPSISANGSQDGIVWAIESNNGGTLHAYDASDLSRELYSSDQKSGDKLGNPVKFSVPTVADGKVYAGTQNSLDVYGLLDPAPTVAGAAGSAASAPGGLISIYGANLAADTAKADSLPLPNTLGGASVDINGVAIPLLYASPTQINAQVPQAAALGTASIVVHAGSINLPPAVLTIQASAPSLFTLDGVHAAAQNQDGTINSPAAPAPPGSVLAVYCTGLGALDHPVQTGEAATSTPLSRTVQPVTATVGAQDAEVLFSGLSPGSVGLYQVNVQIPSMLAGDYPLGITIGGVTSGTALVSVGKNASK